MRNGVTVCDVALVIFVNTFLLTNTTHKHITPRNGERGSLVTPQMNQPGTVATITALQMAKWAQSDEDDDDDDGEGEEATEEERGAAL